MRLKAVVAGEVDEGAVVDDESVGVLADDRGLHAIVEDGARRAADRLEGRDMAAQDALQVLVEDEPRPHQPGVAEHHREQPDDADPRLVLEPTSNLAKPMASMAAYAKQCSYAALRAEPDLTHAVPARRRRTPLPPPPCKGIRRAESAHG